MGAVLWGGLRRSGANDNGRDSNYPEQDESGDER